MESVTAWRKVPAEIFIRRDLPRVEGREWRGDAPDIGLRIGGGASHAREVGGANLERGRGFGRDQGRRVDAADHVGVVRAIGDLRYDIERVTKRPPAVVTASISAPP